MEYGYQYFIQDNAISLAINNQGDVAGAEVHCFVLSCLFNFFFLNVAKGTMPARRNSAELTVN